MTFDTHQMQVHFSKCLISLFLPFFFPSFSSPPALFPSSSPSTHSSSSFPFPPLLLHSSFPTPPFPLLLLFPSSSPPPLLLLSFSTPPCPLPALSTGVSQPSAREKGNTFEIESGAEAIWEAASQAYPSLPLRLHRLSYHHNEKERVSGEPPSCLLLFVSLSLSPPPTHPPYCFFIYACSS